MAAIGTSLGARGASLTAALTPALSNALDAPLVLNLLERIAGDLMSSRGGHNLPSLRSELVGRGSELAARADYRSDISALRVYSLQTEQALRGLEVVESEAGVPVGIVRECQATVNTTALDHTKANVLTAVRQFSDFTEDNDPHKEHDFGAFEVDGERFFWKIDYYDLKLEGGSENPADPSLTTRVLTIMLASEY